MRGQGAGVEEVRWDKQGLVPAIVQDAGDGAVLMLGWMDREALEATLSTGEVHFHSRSRDRLWRKGETSGNVLSLVGVTVDCDRDALLITARAAGPTCHTGDRSCFFTQLHGPAPQAGLSLSALFAVLQQRAEERPEGSYTVKMLDDPDKLVLKVVEEASEVMLAVKNDDRDNLVWELADVLYHLAVVMVAKGVAQDEVNRELERRAMGAKR
jgi:phosphoribosyl-ATP pyrophosphohydrolase/phosphoribosyl-AMP cyclohydrolase